MLHFIKLACHFFQGACSSGEKKENGLFPKHMACIFQCFFANQKPSEGSSNMAFQMALQTWPSRHDLPDIAFQDSLQAGTSTFKNMVL